MPRSRQLSETELRWCEQARQAHEARERHARWETTRAAEELVWLLHRLRFRCERCGVASAGPFIENAGSPSQEEIVNWERPANLVSCHRCGRWLCRRCGRYRRGIGCQCCAEGCRVVASPRSPLRPRN